MKKYIIFGSLFFGFLGLISCSEESQEDSHPYYKFDASDASVISNYNYVKGQIITYQNQLGEQIHFKVIFNESKKYGDYTNGTFSGGGGILESYYDSKIVRLEMVENQMAFNGELVNYIFSKSKNTFKSGINFPIWNILDSGFFDEIDRDVNINLGIYSNHSRVPITINGHLFNKVVLIESGFNTPASPNWGSLPNNVNKLYYDYDFGIVQFNDLDGNEWKVIYPQ